MIAMLLLAGAVSATTPGTLDGEAAFTTHCASCHGSDLRGSLNAPSIRGAGAAGIDFWLVTGRMPAAVPWLEVGHRGAQLSPHTIAAIEAYVAAVAPGGPAIPAVTAGGDLRRGRALYEQNCEHCHGVGADGGAIGDVQWAPDLHAASITQVAEAVRIGPSEMPRFSTAQINDPELTDLASYVFALDERAATRHIPAATSGPVPEGMLGWLVVGALGTLAFAFSRRPS